MKESVHLGKESFEMFRFNGTEIFIKDDKFIKNFKQMDEPIPCGVESDEHLSSFVTLDESATLDNDALKFSVEMEPFFNKIKRQIEINICDLKTVIDDLNKMRGKF